MVNLDTDIGVAETTSFASPETNVLAESIRFDHHLDRMSLKQWIEIS
jgi:hypothetical protein